MKSTLTVVKDAAQNVMSKVSNTLLGMAFLVSGAPAFALTNTDLTNANSGSTKKLSDVATNLDSASQTIASLLIQFVSVGGFVVVAISLYQLYKASKDEREKPTSAVVGLFIGGAMAAVGTIMWIMKNTIIA